MKRDLQLQYPAGKINQNISNRQVLARLSIYGASSYIVAFSDIFPLCFMAAVLGHAGPNCTWTRKTPQRINNISNSFLRQWSLLWPVTLTYAYACYWRKGEFKGKKAINIHGWNIWSPRISLELMRDKWGMTAVTFQNQIVQPWYCLLQNMTENI